MVDTRKITWAAFITQNSRTGKFKITVTDKATKSYHHPMYPFPAESYNRKLAVQKAKRMVKRVRESGEWKIYKRVNHDY